MVLSEKELQGFHLNARDGDVGKVKDLYFDDEHWTTRYLVVQAGSWLNGRYVLLSTRAVRTVDRTARSVSVDATQEDVRGSPPVSSDRPVSRQQEERLHDYYRWPYYWTAAPYAGPMLVPGAAPQADVLRDAQARSPAQFGDARPTPSIDTERQPRGDSHLRSAREIRGYRLEAHDGRLGHIEDILIDQESWKLRCFVVDTRNWWPGKTVLIPSAAVRDFRFQDSIAAVALRRDEIKAAPEYDPARGLTVEYAVRLDRHYESASR